MIQGAPECTVFPSDNVWNARVDGLDVAANSSTMISTIGSGRSFHMDFGSYAGYGIPYQVVDEGTTTLRTVIFDYADESDPGPYPIPVAPLIEDGSDGHMLMVDRVGCKLYELFAARQSASGTWHAGSGAIWDLSSNDLRPDGWTSADAAGLPILPGLVRWDEVAGGEITHALRFTAPETRDTYIYPARHEASSSHSASLPPMGLRVRLKANADLSGLSHDAKVIAVALQRYGMILADNGSPWYVSGMSDPRFDDDVLHELDIFHGSNLEVVDTSGPGQRPLAAPSAGRPGGRRAPAAPHVTSSCCATWPTPTGPSASTPCSGSPARRPPIRRSRGPRRSAGGRHGPRDSGVDRPRRP